MVLYIPVNHSDLARWTLEFLPPCRTLPRPWAMICGETSHAQLARATRGRGFPDSSGPGMCVRSHADCARRLIEHAKERSVMSKPPDNPPSVLPLNLCQVLEDEYAATQGAPAAHLGWDIQPDQLTTKVILEAWRAAMDEGSNASANPATAFSDHVLGLIRTQHDGH